jgi:hypothetical protein
MIGKSKVSGTVPNFAAVATIAFGIDPPAHFALIAAEIKRIFLIEKQGAPTSGAP